MLKRKMMYRQAAIEISGLGLGFAEGTQRIFGVLPAWELGGIIFFTDPSEAFSVIAIFADTTLLSVFVLL